MKFKIKREYLGVLLDKASTISTVGAPDVALRTFLFDLDPLEGRLHVLRTDEYASVIAYTDQFSVEDASEPHRVLISSDHLYTLVKTLDCEYIVITVPDENSVEIEAGTYSATWMPFPVKKFPKIPRYTDDKEIKFQKVKSSMLTKTVERIQFVVPVTHYQTNTLQVYFDKSGCWGWDGKRYQRISINASSASKNAPNLELVIPKTALNVVKFIKLSGVEEVQFGVGKEYTFVWVGADFFLYKNPNVVFPKVEFLHSLERKRQSHFDFEVAQLKHMVSRMGITSDVTSKRVNFVIEPKALSLSSEDKFGNRSQECMSINLTEVKEARNKFVLDWVYFLEAFNAISDKSATMYIDQKHVILESSDSYGVIPMEQG